jgi:lipoprotein signal peptidase
MSSPGQPLGWSRDIPCVARPHLRVSIRLMVREAFILTVSAALLDQAIKGAVVKVVAGRRHVMAGGWFSVAPSINDRHGAAALTLSQLAAGWVAALVGCTVLVVWGARLLPPEGMAGLGLAFGGATGNLVDLLRRGKIVDYISLGSWPTFNLADAMIVGGTILVLWGLV